VVHFEKSHNSRDPICQGDPCPVLRAPDVGLTGRFGLGTPSRIVGGEETLPNEYPFMVSLQYFGSHVCGAVILRNDAVATSAHCARVGQISGITLKAGKHNLKETEASEQTRSLGRIVIHPGFPGPFDISNDIAILRTSSPFVFNANVAPIPIVQADHVTEGIASIAGWGSTSEDGELEDVLHKAEVPVVSDEVCRAAYGSDEIEDNMLCAGLPEGGVDMCVGDIGGPLTTEVRGLRYLAGIGSWGFGCGAPGFPGVYTEVAHHVDFINANAD